MKQNLTSIQFTNDELKLLLMLVLCGNYFINGYRQTPQDHYSQLEQKIYHYGYQHYPQLFKYDKESNHYFPKGELDENFLKFYNDFKNEFFYQQLASEMTDKMVNENEMKPNNHSFEAIMDQRGTLFEKVLNELQLNGLKNFQLKL